MYVRIENNQAVEYPLFEGDLQHRFPDLQFPLDTYGTPVPEGYARVVSTTITNYDYSMKYTEGMPIYVDNVWKQNWIATPLADEEKQEQYQYVSYRVREQRNKLLRESDVWVVADRWATYTDTEKTKYSTYRQQLRDVPLQPGFPYSVIWPTLE
jgi:hypothetical protein